METKEQNKNEYDRNVANGDEEGEWVKGIRKDEKQEQAEEQEKEEEKLDTVGKKEKNKKRLLEKCRQRRQTCVRRRMSGTRR